MSLGVTVVVQSGHCGVTVVVQSGHWGVTVVVNKVKCHLGVVHHTEGDSDIMVGDM